MKRILMVLGVLLLTGCSNELACTMETVEETYKSEQKVKFKFDDNDKITDATVEYIMIFEDEETAQTYLNVFNSLKEDYNINTEKNKIIMTSSKNYEQYEQNKEELKEEMEQNGYSCD